MRRTVLSAVAALALIFVVPSQLNSSGCILYLVNNYYSDNTFSTAVGWDDRNCSCYFDYGGSATSWRYHQLYNCDFEELSSSCQEYQSGSWVNVDCPDPGATSQARIRIPIN